MRYVVENGNPVHTSAYRVTPEGQLDLGVRYNGIEILNTPGLRCLGTPAECGLEIQTEYAALVVDVPDAR